MSSGRLQVAGRPLRVRSPLQLCRLGKAYALPQPETRCPGHEPEAERKSSALDGNVVVIERGLWVR